MIAPLPPAAQAIYHNGAQNGERNTQLFKLACQFRDSGLPEFDAVTEAEIWGMKVGLSQNEAVAIFDDGFSFAILAVVGIDRYIHAHGRSLPFLQPVALK